MMQSTAAEIASSRSMMLQPITLLLSLEIAGRIPFMTGSEYLGEEQLQALWQLLHVIFSRRTSAFGGTVEEFLKGYSPDIHVAGRIYFHLVDQPCPAGPCNGIAGG
jgi:hypothetical protein